jgi:hypothetical protein
MNEFCYVLWNENNVKAIKNIVLCLRSFNSAVDLLDII